MGVIVQPSASYSITMRVRLPQRPGAFGQVASAIGETGAILGATDLVRAAGSYRPTPCDD
jgi:malate dehydrogenase (oxaloacetate-decarboxylating)